MMALDDIITMNSRGMITIPKNFREKHHYTAGSQFSVMDLDGVLTIIPIIPLEELRNDLIPHKQLISTLEEDRARELELEK